MLGEDGRQLLLCLAHHIVGIGLVEVVEHAAHLGQLLATALKGSDGVVKGGSLCLGYDSVDLGTLLGKSFHEGCFVVGRLVLGKLGGAERQSRIGQHGIVVLCITCSQGNDGHSDKCFFHCV